MARSNGIRFGEYSVPIPDHQNHIRVDSRSGAAVETRWSIQQNIPVYDPHANRDIAASKSALIPNPSDLRTKLFEKLKRPVTAKKLKQLMEAAGIMDTADQVAITLLAQSAGLLKEDDEDAARKVAQFSRPGKGLKLSASGRRR